jgi:signal peptidase II
MSVHDDLGTDRMSKLRGTALFVVTVVAVLVLDQLTKWLALQVLPPEGWPSPTSAIGHHFSFNIVGNTGVAFGLFQGQSDLFVVLALVVVGGLLVYRHRLPADDWLLEVAIGLQVGGALGNLLDRVRIGHVRDFIDFRIWPVFNVADMAIVSGVLLLAWHLWRQEQAASTIPATDAAEDQPTPAGCAD